MMRRPWRNLPLVDWPDADRSAWEELLREGDVLDGQGPGAHWSKATRRTNLKHYAGWLGWLEHRGLLTSGSGCTDRVSPDRVADYARDLMACVAPKTVSSYLRDLKVVLKAMAPQSDRRWFDDLTNRLKHWAKPSRSRRRSTLSAAEMFQIVLRDLDTLRDSGLTSPTERRRYRDVLMVAILISAPIRLRNLAMTRIGTQLNMVGRDWRLAFSAQETKTGQPVDLILHEALGVHIEAYMAKARLAPAADDNDDRLWISARRTPMAHMTIYERVRRMTEDLFGEAMPPHAFRSIGATFLAEMSPEDALHARPLLGHRSAKTTEAYYVRARQIRSSQKTNEAIQRIRDGGGSS